MGIRQAQDFWKFSYLLCYTANPLISFHKSAILKIQFTYSYVCGTFSSSLIEICCYDKIFPQHGCNLFEALACEETTDGIEGEKKYKALYKTVLSVVNGAYLKQCLIQEKQQIYHSARKSNTMWPFEIRKTHNGNRKNKRPQNKTHTMSITRL